MPSFNPCTGIIASPAPQRRIVVKPHQSPSNNHYRRHSGRNSLHPPSSLIGSLSPGATSPGNRRRKDIGDYWLGKTLGKGSSGRVKLGIHKISGEKVAIKIISKSHLAANASVERAVKREIAVMKLIHHPNIMSLLDVIDLSDSPNLYLILEYVQGGELFEYLVSQGRLSEPEARKYFQQIIFGLDYCHRHLICHRDLKPENLLLDKDKNIKIADFGMASLQPTGSLLETSCGSPHYASPEIVTGVPYNGSASDIWSCGIILYALLCGHLPFDDDNIRELLNKVKIGKYKMPDHVSLSARDLIQKILVIRPEKRLTMKEVQQHPWFTTDPPLNPSILPDPPTAKEIGRPVSDTSEIDDRLLETLKVLWTDLTTEQVIEALLNEEYNMQKVTYVLLQRHASNYWQIDRDEDIRSSDKLGQQTIIIESPAKRRRPATICGVASGNGVSNSKEEPLPGIDDMMHKLVAENTGKIKDNNNSKSSQIDIKRVDSSMSTSQGPSDRNVGDVDLPPPVPPKPIVIRADLIYNQARAEASASLKSPRAPQRWPYTPVQQRQDICSY
ncbi:hypothetical protein INT45_000274 [Circinella minor]|uniref:non-specific serine/threonine protein kinase n=1 Tax=Circinella minor TaxID=1195481 RepID=A0A8H7VPP9_9FUNG|nr:hypothetical protein INT45_000274 [Circinella minor]